jgi:hypothetical protein
MDPWKWLGRQRKRINHMSKSDDYRGHVDITIYLTLFRRGDNDNDDNGGR